MTTKTLLQEEERYTQAKEELKKTWAQWLMSMILDNWEAEFGMAEFKGTQAKVHETLSHPIKK
jgi:hypothetical protein